MNPAVRIISGEARGRRLKVPSRGTRPTSGLVRGALLNMLVHRGYLDGGTLVDLFAGSGALGLEALSRGAERVVFVEAAPSAVRVLRENIAAAGLGTRAEVLPLRAEAALHRLARAGRTVAGIFADPPYEGGWVRRTLDAIVESGVLAADGWIAIEHHADEPVPPSDLALVASRRHGRSTVTILQQKGPQP